MSKMLTVLLLVILSFSFTGELYTVFADREFGLWSIRSNNTSHKLSYIDKTLNINTGDTVTWVNLDENGDRITMISDNNLWEGGKVLGGAGSIFRFTFNSSGKYKFHILERNRVVMNTTLQNISVYDEETDTWENTTNDDPYTVTSYPPRYQTIVATGPTVGNGTSKVAKKAPLSKPVQTGGTNVGVTKSNTTQPQQKANTTVGSVMVVQSGKNVTTTPKVIVIPKATATPKPTPTATPKPIESYQEFTLYEMLKRWYEIIKG